MIDNSYLYYYRRNISLSNDFKYPNTFFRIIMMDNLSNVTFYRIEELLKKFKLSYLNNTELNFNMRNDDSHLWNLIEINDKKYIFHNKNNCYIKVQKSAIVCANINYKKAAQFKIVRLFSEVKNNKSPYNLELLKKEPIDVLIKYIDLKDPNLNREGIHQIEKDYDNEELRYSIRSILKNIPWIRKIFILMPNKKVRFFKEYNLIKEKIVYIKDIDILGHDSSNCNAFLYRYWKLKKFGISDNIIIMDDDCFIGNKIEKSDFFYIKGGKVIPSIITSNFIKINEQSVKENRKLYEKKAKYSKEEQNNDVFLYSKYLTYEFILQFFNVSYEESLYIPNFTHNAIPVNLKEVKEIYDLTYSSKYKYATLDCLYRISGYLQFQIFILSYTFIKYNRKVRNIPNKFIRINNTLSSDFNISLFCINKGEGNYSYIDFYEAKITMEYLFPIPSPYEIVDNTFSVLSHNVTTSLERIIKFNQMQISNMISKSEHLIAILNIIIILILIFLKIYVKIGYDKYYSI